MATAHAALAEAQDRLYWLDRWGVDLNAVMRRPGPGGLRLAPPGGRGLAAAASGPSARAKGARTGAAAQRHAPEPITAPRPRRPTGSHGARARPTRCAPRRSPTCCSGAWPRPTSRRSSARRGRRSPAGLDDAASGRRAAAVSLAVHHGVPGRARAHRADRGDAARRRARDGARAAGDGRLALLRRPGGRRLRQRGRPIEPPGRRCLDFGCSSGRAVRVLAAALPGRRVARLRPHRGRHRVGAGEHRRRRVPAQPRGPAAALRGRVASTASFAISIWSHFSASAAESWLAEMQRIVKPGGALLLTTHGLQTVAHDHRTHRRTEEQLRAARAALYHDGPLVLGRVRPGRRPRHPEPGLGNGLPHPGVAAGAGHRATGGSRPSRPGGSRTTRTCTSCSAGSRRARRSPS